MTSVVKSEPWMDADGLECFKRDLSYSQCYLEYGCGGSTVYASEVAEIPIIISVESDGSWIPRVLDSIKSTSSKVYLNHCDLGEVGEWGVPKAMDRISDFWRYMYDPWLVVESNGFIPDTILIDGRFRVASFLYSMSVAAPGVVILFDDYFDRQEYHIVESHFGVPERHGRMARFVKTNITKLSHKLLADIAAYSIRWG